MKAVFYGLLLTYAWGSAALHAQTPAKAPTAVSADDDAPAGKADGHDHDAHDDHDHGHGHAHLGHDGVNTEPDEVKKDLAIFSAIVFLLLVIILRKFAWGPIAAGLEKREHHIAHEIASAEKVNADAKHLLADYQKKLDAVQAEVRAILDEARRDAQHTQAEIVAKAKAEAATETARGLREISTAKDQALDELSKVAVDQALSLAGKLLQQKLQPADHTRLIDEALSKFSSKSANLN